MGKKSGNGGRGRRVASWPTRTKFLMIAALTAALGLALYFMGTGKTYGEGVWISAILALLYAGAMLLLVLDSPADGPGLFVCALFLTAAAVILRASMLDWRSGDYNSFLVHWAAFFRENGGFKALDTSIGDYNLPYLYFLAAISYIPLSDLYLIKLFSVMFDVAAAFFAMKTAGLFVKGRAARLAVFAAVLFYPTVWLNSAYWAQCDSIYGALVMASLYFALSKRPSWSVIMAALAFSFKLQTIFFLPVFILFIMAKRMKPAHLLLFPTVYFLSVLPAMLLGRPLLDVVAIYFRQAGSYDGWLTLNAPSMFAMVRNAYPVELFKWLGIAAAVLFVFIVYAVAWKRYRRLEDKSLFIAAFLFCVGIPFLLPSMHERYFYLAEIMSVVYVAVIGRRWFVPLVLLTASFAGYYAYLNGEYLYELEYAALLMMLVAALLTTDFILELRGNATRRLSKEKN